MSDIFDGLNAEQQDAVGHGDGPLLIIAGAGTGKTTVITRRIAHLIESQQATPDEILALTFTEKAAGEMEERVDALVTDGYADLWISTFHAFGERILRDHSFDIGLSSDFRLLAETEQWMLLREYIESFDLDYYRPKGNPGKFVQGLLQHFSRLKDEDITPQQYVDYAEQLLADTEGARKKTTSPEEAAQRDEAMRISEAAHAYARYEQLLQENNALDFGDLIVKTIHLFQERPAIADLYRTQFKYILVDEFQDTNIAQYELVKLLAMPQNNITVVADDDQAIYSFRGASMSNIAQFQKDFPNVRSVSLIENYRSTQPILDLAYESIQHNNPDRLEVAMGIQKRLHANSDEAAENTTIIEHIHADTLAGEIKLIIDRITDIKKAHPEMPWKECAILVRANAHAQELLPYLDRSGIPYQFVASQGLFVKPIVLDVIAFLDLLDNYHESRSFYRVLTFAVWNIDTLDIMSLTRYASKTTQSLFEVCQEVRLVAGLQEATVTTIEKIMQLIDRFSQEARYRTVGEVALRFLESSGYLKTITDQETPDAQEQVLYLNQFFGYIERFEKSAVEKTVRLFMRELRLMIESGDQGTIATELFDGPDAVRVMTIHASKGLEFEHVFVINLVNLRFPSSKRRDPIEVPQALIKETLPEGDYHLQEERRLFYVALTRAKRGLYLTSAADYGGTRKKKISRFLVEVGFEKTPPTPTGQVALETGSAIKTHSSEDELQHLPKTFSFTQLKAFETCPWQYRFAFLLKVPTPGKPSFSFGKTLHNTLYEFFKRIQEQEASAQLNMFDDASSKQETTPHTLQQLLEIYEEKWQGEWYLSKKQREEYYAKGREALTAFYDLHKEQWPTVRYLEQAFTVRIGEHGLRGAIDRVDRIEGSDEAVNIIDYKTGSVPKSGKKDMDQLYLYALALRQVFDLEPVKLSYYFIEDNVTIEEEMNSEKMQRVSEWALSLIEKILAGNFAATPGRQCNFCDFKNICEFRSK